MADGDRLSCGCASRQHDAVRWFHRIPVIQANPGALSELDLPGLLPLAGRCTYSRP